MMNQAGPNGLDRWLQNHWQDVFPILEVVVKKKSSSQNYPQSNMGREHL
jgi:hypothetical protein